MTLGTGLNREKSMKVMCGRHTKFAGANVDHGQVLRAYISVASQPSTRALPAHLSSRPRTCWRKPPRANPEKNGAAPSNRTTEAARAPRGHAPRRPERPGRVVSGDPGPSLGPAHRKGAPIRHRTTSSATYGPDDPPSGPWVRPCGPTWTPARVTGGTSMLRTGDTVNLTG